MTITTRQEPEQLDFSDASASAQDGHCEAEATNNVLALAVAQAMELAVA